MVTGNGYRQWIADNVTPMMNDTPTNAWQLAGWCTLCSCGSCAIRVFVKPSSSISAACTDFIHSNLSKIQHRHAAS